MSGRRITVTETLVVPRPPEVVFDFTQDYARRSEWDRGILAAHVLAREPVPRVQVRARGGLTAIFEYRQFERPRATSLAMVEVVSPWIEGGGGAWTYAKHPDGTLWTQTNTLVLRARWWSALAAPVVRRELSRSTRHAMRAARDRLR